MKINIERLLFMDIETVSGVKRFENLAEKWQELWVKKIGRSLPEGFSIDEYYTEKAALFAEFGKVVCISVGYYNSRGNQQVFRLKSLFGEGEREILKEFSELLFQFEKHDRTWGFAGHNIREFDLPYLSRRMLINGLSIPDSMSFYNQKPWEMNIIDTMQIWRFGDFKNYTSLELLSASLGVPSPKSDINGSQVGEVFWQGDYKRIAEYCQRDVLAVANIINRMNGEPILTEDLVEIV